MEFDEGLIEFLDARDEFLWLGNYILIANRMSIGLKRLERCTEYEEAMWIVSTFGDIPNICEARCIARLNGQTSYYAMVYCFLITGTYTMGDTLPRLSGHPLILGIFEDTRELAASKGDRNALFRLGQYEKAALLGHYGAIRKMYRKYQPNDTMFWQWMGRLSKEEFCGNISWLLTDREQYQASVIYTIGKICFQRGYDGSHMDIAIRQYKYINQLASNAVIYWMMVAKHLGIYRDVAKLIGQLVWAERSNWK
jgi:hypothetical protein